MPAHRTRRKPPPPSRRPPRLHPDDQWDPANDETVGERIVNLMALGDPLDHAAAAVGVSGPEVRQWMRGGVSVLAQDAAGKPWESFTVDERSLANFAFAALKAEGDWIARQHAMLEAASRGGGTVTTTTQQTIGGVTTTSSSTRTIPGDPRVIMWRLERRFPNVYGPRATVDVLGVDLSNDPDTRDRLRERLLGIAERLALQPGDNDERS